MKTKLFIRQTIFTFIFLFIGVCSYAQYKLPFEGGTNVLCTQGNFGSTSHTGESAYAFDFKTYNAVANNTVPIVAARGGCIRRLKTNGFACHTNISACLQAANFVVISHGDGTEAVYWHLGNVTVTLGQNVSQGEQIGFLGNTGYTVCGGGCAPNGQLPDGTHLHFHVQNYSGNCPSNADSYTQSIPISFDDAGVPTTNSYNISQNTDKKPLSSDISLYGGHTTTPRAFYLNIRESDVPWSITHNQISNFRISGITNAIPTSRIEVMSTFFVQNTAWRRVKVLLQSSDIPSAINDGNFRTVSFDLTSGGQTIRFENKYLYFGNFNASTSFTDISDLHNWSRSYILRGASMGLFKGSSMQTFNPSQHLQRQHAAKVIVEAGVRLGLLNINTATNVNGSFNDVPQSSEFFKHIQTLRNYGYINASTSFNPTNAMSVAQICKILSNVFQLQSSDFASANYTNQLLRKIIPTSSDSSLIPFMSQILRLVDIRESAPGFSYGENVWDFLDYSMVNAVIGAPIQVSGDVPITRAIMAKMLSNIVIWKIKTNNITTFSVGGNNENQYIEFSDFQTLSSQNVDDFISIGEKYDNAAITANSTPTVPVQQSYSVPSGGSLTLQYNSGTFPQHFYWSMEKNGATLVSNNALHSSVTFTAPTVSSPTQWKLYTYTANNKGKAIETNITINVGGSSGGSSSAPTQQAHSLNLYNVSQNSMTANWTRGNGQFCLVTCKEVGANSQDLPDAGVIYNGNSNYSSAPSIFNGSDTKVVYTGTANSVNITGLNSNTQYQIAVFEYNGSTPSSVFYNLNNAPITNGTTLQQINNDPIANFTWNENLIFQTGQSFVFTNTSQNANTFQWSISPSGNINNPTSASNVNVTFNTSGQHTLTLIATNTTTGITSTRTHNFFVYNANDLLAELQPTNLNFTSPMIGGQNLTITCNVQNNSPASQLYTTHVTFVLSTDQTIDASDHFLGQQSLTIGAGESVSVSHIATNIYNSFSGNYYILAYVDYWNNVPNGYVPESNETNNMTSKPIVIQAALPDFVALSIIPSTSIVSSGQQFSVSGTFRNIGLGNAQFNNVFADFYISNDNVLSLDDIKINGTIFVSNNGSILNGNSPIVTGSTNLVRLPYDIPNGNYFLICAVDYSRFGFGYEFDFNIESNENNNFISTPITVSNPNQPTINASNLSISNITQNSLTLNWARGNGDGCVVLARANSDLPNKIVDNVSYTSNSNFELAPGIQGYYTSADGSFSVDNYSYVKLVYDGTASNVNVTGLSPNETYSFIVLEYNGSGNSKDYFQNTFLKCISAHTLGQDSSTSFKRLFGSIVTGTNSSVYHPSSVKFFDENTGVIFRNYNGIGLTNNAGLSWNFINNEIINRNSDSWLRSSSWLDNGYGWLAFENGAILKTTDFGLNWTETKLDRSIEDVCFVNQNIGFVALKNLLNVSGNDGAIYKTVNGGVTWNPIGAFPRRISSVYFINENLGWATSFSTSSSFDKIFYKTTDGGSTWSQVIFSTNPSQSYILTDLYFTSENNGFAMTIFGWLIKTNNGGVTWSMHNIFNVTSTINTYSKIEFVNQQIGYINLQNKKIAKTNDGGLTWSIDTIHNDFPSNSSGSTAEIDVVNENLVFVSGISGLLKTSTGGQSNAIVLTDVSGQYCIGNTIPLAYSITGQYTANNIFRVELSNNQGNFSSPIVLATFSNSGSGSLNVALPNSLLASANYKLRIVATDPSINSNETSSFAIANQPTVTVSINPQNPSICPDASITFNATATNFGSNPQYVWKRNGVIVGSNSNAYTANDFSNNETIWVELTSSANCASTTPSISNVETISVTDFGDVFIQAIDDVMASSHTDNIQWFRNGQPIAGATSQFYEATQTGFYQFSVTINGCTVMSEIYNLETLSVDEITNNVGAITIYPNPSADKVNVVSNIYTIEEVRLFNLNGQVILTSKSNDLNHSVDISNYSQGVYILEVRTTDGLEKFKIIKK